VCEWRNKIVPPFVLSDNCNNSCRTYTNSAAPRVLPLQTLMIMLPLKYRHRYEALLKDNRNLSLDAEQFSETVKQVHLETLYFSEDIVAQEEYYMSLTKDPGVRPALVIPLEEQLMDLAVSLSALSKKLSACANRVSRVVGNITDSFCALVNARKKLESTSMRSKDRELLLNKMERTYNRLKLQYYRYKYELLEQQETLGRLRLLGLVGVN
jgi:hypothetical protein